MMNINYTGYCFL